MKTIEQRLQKHCDFWAGQPLESPLMSIRVGDVFMSRQFKTNHRLLAKNRAVTPDDVSVDDYLGEYESMYQTHEQVGQDGFFVGEPINGFPWFEAICGCEIVGAEVSFVSRHRYESIDELETIGFSRKNPWYQKYLAFLTKVGRVSAGRFPLGQPILRGVSDTLGALVGQEEMVCGLMLESDKMKRLFGEVVQMHRTLVEDAYGIMRPWQGGHSIGFYYIWAPGRVIWFQEDLAAIMAPQHFDEFLRQTATDICAGYPYTLEHLHPASFGHLDGILSLPFLSAVQINREDVGPGLPEILPQLQRVLAAGKRLVILGELDDDDIETVAAHLPHQGIALHCMVPTVEAGNELIDRMSERCAFHGWKV